MPLNHVITTIPDASALERMPHLVRKICGVWGTEELDVFISRLIFDARDGDRQGLPVDVADELMWLAKLNKSLRAMARSEKLGVNYETSLKAITAADEQKLQADILDNPMVSMDTVIRQKSAARVEKARASRDEGSNVFVSVLLTLLHPKSLAILVVLALVAKLIWPTIRPLFR